jgi:Amt family ammonium transporter
MHWDMYESQANAGIPDILLAAFHFTFVTATAMILAGAMLERGRLFPSMLFLFCWTTFVLENCFVVWLLG